jgi:hypothetical protein
VKQPLLDEVLASKDEDLVRIAVVTLTGRGWLQHPSERLAHDGFVDRLVTKQRKRRVGCPEAANELPVSHVHGVMSKQALAAVRLSRSGTTSRRS